MEEIIAAPFKDRFKFKEIKFHSGGREDIDVRMLGNGRPFLIELVSPQIIRENL